MRLLCRWLRLVSPVLLSTVFYSILSVQALSQDAPAALSRRRKVFAIVASLATIAECTLCRTVNAIDELQSLPMNVAPFQVVTDPNTYLALAYSPPSSASRSPPPLIFFLHGAGRNQRDITNLADMRGEYAGLLPSLVASGRAPIELAQHFAILAPYAGIGQTSFYEQPRSRLLQFLSWAASEDAQHAGCPVFDPTRVIAFGFSDGATVAVELLTTRRFQAGVICSYGFTGTLPDLALQRLKGIPIWIWHSQDDAIFSVHCSDKLFRALQTVNGYDNSSDRNLIRYSRFEQDPENFLGSVKGHTTGITASRDISGCCLCESWCPPELGICVGDGPRAALDVPDMRLS